MTALFGGFFFFIPFFRFFKLAHSLSLEPMFDAAVDGRWTSSSSPRVSRPCNALQHCRGHPTLHREGYVLRLEFTDDAYVSSLFFS